MRNKTVYSEETFKIINRQRVFSKDMLFIKGSAIAITINLGARAVYADNKSIAGWITCFIAIVVAPIAFFVYPLSNGKKEYKKVCESNKGKEMVATIDFEKNNIVAHNNLGQVGSVKYDDINEMVETNKLLILKSKGKDVVHLDKQGFINSSPEECKELLYERCKNLKRKKR